MAPDYWAVGEYTLGGARHCRRGLPLMLAGIFIGTRVHTGLSDLAFRRAVSGALIVSGLALLAKTRSDDSIASRALTGWRD